MPFAGYRNFADCVKKNQNKKNPEVYCASIEWRARGTTKKSKPKKKR